MRKLIANEWMTLDGVVQAPSYADEDITGGSPGSTIGKTPARGNRARRSQSATQRSGGRNGE